MSAPKVFAVLGDPVAHSKSPDMHAAAFAALGLPHRYVALRVPAPGLAAALEGVRALGLAGLNLTVPHKETACALVDELDDVARTVGAVNTVAVVGGALRATNTDVGGFADALAELDPSAPRRAVVLGGGGASRAIVAALDGAGAQVAWVSRRPAAIAPLGRAQPRSWFQLDEALAGADTLVNATTVGMNGGPADFPRPIALDALADGARVIDAVYPRPTGGLLDRADQAGLRTQDGRAMLLWQGVRALKVWLDREIDAPTVAAMRATLA